MKAKKEYELVRNQPVARFYYQGSHTHPVRRTVLLIKNQTNSNILVGYELREGRTTRNLRNAPIKSFRRSEIASFGDYGRLRFSKTNKKRKKTDSTLTRTNLIGLIRTGA
tara:strand:+ start:25858 stop:26187 length:330 start_codon:yes stop_codon:yes gene_type:complete